MIVIKPPGPYSKSSNWGRRKAATCLTTSLWILPCTSSVWWQWGRLLSIFFYTCANSYHDDLLPQRPSSLFFSAGTQAVREDEKTLPSFARTGTLLSMARHTQMRIGSAPRLGSYFSRTNEIKRSFGITIAMPIRANWQLLEAPFLSRFPNTPKRGWSNSFRQRRRSIVEYIKEGDQLLWLTRATQKSLTTTQASDSGWE